MPTDASTGEGAAAVATIAMAAALASFVKTYNSKVNAKQRLIREFTTAAVPKNKEDKLGATKVTSVVYMEFMDKLLINMQTYLSTDIYSIEALCAHEGWSLVVYNVLLMSTVHTPYAVVQGSQTDVDKSGLLALLALDAKFLAQGINTVQMCFITIAGLSLLSEQDVDIVWGELCQQLQMLKNADVHMPLSWTMSQLFNIFEAVPGDTYINVLNVMRLKFASRVTTSQSDLDEIMTFARSQCASSLQIADTKDNNKSKEAAAFAVERNNLLKRAQSKDIKEKCQWCVQNKNPRNVNHKAADCRSNPASPAFTECEKCGKAGHSSEFCRPRKKGGQANLVINDVWAEPNVSDDIPA
jgi:hypothetical protein